MYRYSGKKTPGEPGHLCCFDYIVTSLLTGTGNTSCSLAPSLLPRLGAVAISVTTTALLGEWSGLWRPVRSGVIRVWFWRKEHRLARARVSYM
jgi:hypothetical protein